ncbi:MAG: hypothetical protein IPM51_15780 [Sphingobacteriaceae bacterium]|nr:hypothetical protein [Sphingobacteriaceae bacterium]
MLKRIMHNLFGCLFLWGIVTTQVKAQTYNFPESIKHTMIAELTSPDSLVFYQCHVESATQELKTSGGQTLQTAPQKYSITEKIIVYLTDSVYRAKYFVSSMVILPNRRFSGLKIKERKYWNFKLVSEKTLNERDLKILGAIQLKGKEPTEYDFAITKYNTNQVIIKKTKEFKQLVIEGDYILSKIIFDPKRIESKID